MRAFSSGIPKIIIKNPQRIFLGAKHLAKAVSLTLGPSGRNVTIDPWTPEMGASLTDLSKYPEPLITKDGVTVASHIKTLQSDRLSSVGAQLLIDAAQKTNEACGDGTTTCTVIAKGVLEQGIKLQSSDLNQVRTGI